MEFALNVFSAIGLTFPLRVWTKMFPSFWIYHWFEFPLLLHRLCKNEVIPQLAWGSFDFQGVHENTSVCLSLPFFISEIKQRSLQAAFTLMRSCAAFNQEDVKMRQRVTPMRNSKEITSFFHKMKLPLFCRKIPEILFLKLLAVLW